MHVTKLAAAAEYRQLSGSCRLQPGKAAAYRFVSISFCYVMTRKHFAGAIQNQVPEMLLCVCDWSQI